MRKSTGNFQVKAIAAALSLGLVISSVSAPAADAKAKKAKLAKTKLDLEVNQTKKVKIKNAKKVKWSVDKKGKKAIKIVKGTKTYVKIKGTNPGTAKVTAKATAKGAKKAKKLKLTVTVTDKQGTKKSPAPGVSSAPSKSGTPAASQEPGVSQVPGASQDPAASPQPSAAAEQTLALDKFVGGGSKDKPTYDSAAGVLRAKNVECFFLPLTEKLTAGTVVNVVIKGKDNGSKGFRAWLAMAGTDANLSEQLKSTDNNVSGEFSWSFSVTSTDDVDSLEFKGISYQDVIEDLEISEVKVTYTKNQNKPTKAPKPTNLPADVVPARKTEAPGVHAVAANPLISADVPDLDYLRVGDDYYMVSTTMFLSPGVPIMHSKDLVHWETITYVYDTMEDNDTTNLKNGKNCYGRGSWAASLKYSDGLYYVCFTSNDQNKTYIYTTDDIANGTWKKHSSDGGHHDPGLLFDNGKSYIVWGQGTISIQEFELTETGISYKGSPQVIIEKKTGGLPIEGSHIYHIGDYYYIFFIEWPSGGERMQWCFRSKSLTGQWEGKNVFRNQGIAQGGIIDTQYEDWYAILFKDNGALGRTPVLLDVYWVDDWPMLGSDGGKAKASDALDVNLTSQGESKVVSNDDFTYSENKLDLVWQWNHNPDNENWSVTEREGYLRLRTGSLAKTIIDARNSLTQRTVGPACSSESCIDAANMKPGDYAGICAFGPEYGQVGVMKDESGKSYIYYGKGNFTDRNDLSKNVPMTVAASDKVALSGSKAYLKIIYDFKTNKATFKYSLDGKKWTDIGGSIQMSYDTSTTFMGYRTYLFNFATKEIGGYVDFDYYKVNVED